MNLWKIPLCSSVAHPPWTCDHMNVAHLKVEGLRGTLAPRGPSRLQPLVRGGRVGDQAGLQAASVASDMEVLTGKQGMRHSQMKYIKETLSDPVGFIFFKTGNIPSFHFMSNECNFSVDCHSLVAVETMVLAPLFQNSTYWS